MTLISCIYLIKLNKTIYKYGRTQNYNVRKYGHKQEYKNFTNNIQLIHLEPINKRFLNEAENDIKKLLFKYKYVNKRKELLDIPDSDLNQVKNLYCTIGLKYREINNYSKSFYLNTCMKLSCITVILFSHF